LTACFSNPALPAGLARRWRGLCRVGLPALLALATPLAMLLALGIGRFPLPPTEVLGYALAKLGWLSLPPARLALLDNLIIDIRLPRVLTAVLGGGYLLWLMHRRTGQGGVL
jgi:iron complex transport system permease protein